MKLVLFTRDGGNPTAGVLTDRGIVPFTAYASLEPLIDVFATSRAALERQVTEETTIALAEVQLLRPLPRPGKILCSTAAHAGERPQLLFTLKSAESVVGPGATVQLPPVGSEWEFVPEAELGLVIKGPAKRVKAASWRDAVFGFTCVIDVMARGDTMFGRDFWLAKSDTLGPLGPCVVTADEIADPAALRVRSFINDQPAQDYAMSGSDYSVGEQLELATTIMTLHTGDVLACGTSADGLRPIRDGDSMRVEISDVGHLDVRIATLAEVAA